MRLRDYAISGSLPFACEGVTAEGDIVEIRGGEVSFALKDGYYLGYDGIVRVSCYGQVDGHFRVVGFRSGLLH